MAASKFHKSRAPPTWTNFWISYCIFAITNTLILLKLENFRRQIDQNLTVVLIQKMLCKMHNSVYLFEGCTTNLNFFKFKLITLCSDDKQSLCFFSSIKHFRNQVNDLCTNKQSTAIDACLSTHADRTHLSIGILFFQIHSFQYVKYLRLTYFLNFCLSRV